MKKITELDKYIKLPGIKKIIRVMKITGLLLMLSVVSVFASKSYSQTKLLSLNIEQATVKDILEKIEDQSEFFFMYSGKVIDVDREVSVNANNQKIDAVLDGLFAGTDVDYTIRDRIIVLTTPEIFYPETRVVFQQPAVSGTVTDESDDPLPGVTVVVKGTTKGTVTNADGEYSLTDIPEDATLVFSFVGMLTQEVEVGNQTTIDVTMAVDAIGIEEVVAIGYGTQKKGNLTGSVSAVKSDELVKSATTNTSQTLAGRVPGMITKQTSGEPGNDYANISIRGFGTPLVIVDGVEASMNNIDPNVIESVSVLKDASAAVYGARAGNGVILITTKRGEVSKPTLTFNSTLSMQGLTMYPEMANAGQYSELIREGQINAGIPSSGLLFTEEQVQKYKEGTEPGYESTDWFDVVMNKYSPLQQHNVSLRGGSDAVKYYTFIGYTGQTGMYKSGDNKLNRYNLRSNIDAQVNKNLSVGLDLSLITSRLESPNRSQSSLWSDLWSSQPVYPSKLPDPTKIAFTGTITSVVASTTRELGGYSDSNSDQIFSTFNIKYLIPGIKGLSVKGLMNYRKNASKTKNWSKQYSMWVYEPQSNTYEEKSGPVSTSLNEGYDESHNLTGQIFVNYDRVFIEKHNLSVLLLTEMSSSKNSGISAGRGEFITNAIDYLFAGTADSQTSNGSASETGRLSYVGRINYGFEGKYLLETTMRYDGSPKFPSNKRWGFFPSISAGWRISEESFIKNNVSWLDNLKLRGGFSQTGFDGIGAFQYLTGFNFANRYVVDHEARTGLRATGLANPNITWEEMTIYNVGLDFSLFRNQLYGEFDAFYREREKILATREVSLPTTFGATLPPENINSQTNRGFELMVGYKNNNYEFKYDISSNISWSRAKWKHFDEPDYTDPDDIRINKKTGNWTNRWFGYQSDGLFTSTEEISNYSLDQDNQGNASLKPGDIKYIDQNDDNKLDWRDEVEIGTGNTPEIMFGININLAYKNFDLSILGQGAAKYQYMLKLNTPNEGNIPEILYDLRWTEENNKKWAKVPRVYFGGKANNTASSDYWLYDASYLRIKTLNIGYNFPKPLLNRLAVSDLRIYFAGTNLLTISGMSKFSIDPEAPSGSRAGFGYPQQKSYSLGINISF